MATGTKKTSGGRRAADKGAGRRASDNKSKKQAGRSRTSTVQSRSKKTGTGKRHTLLKITIYILLIAAAVGGGLYLAGVLKEDAPQHRNFVVSEKITQDGLRENDRELIFSVNPESGDIDGLIVSELDCINTELSFYLLDNDIAYTMSGSLFSTLTVSNIRLPQTVTLGRLYSYYGSEDVYDAARRIVEEMLGVEIPSYIVYENDELSRYITIGGRNDDRLKLHAPFTQLVNGLTDTPGSSLGAVKKLTEGKKSNRTVDDRIRYLEVIDGLTDDDVYLETVPVKEHNESVEVDYSSWYGMITG